MSGAGYASNVHVSYAVEIEPAPGGARRWRLRVLGKLRVYQEVPLIDSSAVEADLELRGLWSGKRPLLLQRG